MSTPDIVVHADAGLLAAATAARLATRLVDAQAARGRAHLVLTGGGIGTAVLGELARSPARDAVDWKHVDLWWGDERFVPSDDGDRNEKQAREALLDHLDLDPARVHPVPASDGPEGGDPERAAERYARELAQARSGDERGQVPEFDVCLLGIGPDTHVASLFPGQPALREKERTVVAVRDAPKPPPTRVSLTLPALCSAREVWLLGSGEGKAEAVRLALSDTEPEQVPAAGARGRSRTLVLLDRSAAGKL